MRFGLLGTGQWAETTQAAALAANPGAEFVGVWGRNPRKAAALAARFGAQGYPDVDDLLADVEAVAVALPPDIQAPLAERAARLGRHLLLDKPLALDVAAADRVVGAVEETGVASVIFFTNRFIPSIRDFLAGPASVGSWDAGRVTMYASIFGPDSPYRDSAWRREHGGLWDVGPHALSLLLPVLGPVERVSAVAAPHHGTHVLLRHRDGAASTMALSLEVPPEAVASEFVFHGRDGFIEVPRGSVDPVTACGLAIDELTATARTGGSVHPCDVRFGRTVVAILAAADTACRNGTVEVP